MAAWSYVVAVAVMGLLVLVHEAGHFLVARRAGIAVAEFSVGVGPRLLGFHRAGTAWTLRLIPLGGYVRWAEDGEALFNDAPARTRAWVLLAGPLANLLFAAVALVLLYGPVLGYGQATLPAVTRAFGYMLSAWAGGLLGLFSGSAADLAGPVGITRAVASNASSGLDYLLWTVAALSFNLTLFNLLPLPVLDGGRLLLLAVERVRRRALDPLVEGWIHAAGFLFFVLLFVVTMVKDLIA